MDKVNDAIVKKGRDKGNLEERDVNKIVRDAVGRTVELAFPWGGRQEKLSRQLIHLLDDGWEPLETLARFNQAWDAARDKHKP